jgi:hypothetical protein
MANTRISALPAASTPLAGTETLPVVQLGITEQVSVANLTAGRAISAASLALTTSPLPTSSGGTALTSFTSNGVLYASSTSALATTSTFAFDGNNLGLGVAANAATRFSLYKTDNTVYTSGARGYLWQQIYNSSTTSGAYCGVEIGVDGVGNGSLATIATIDAGSGTTEFAISTRISNTFADRLRIDASSNVKINEGNLVIGTSGKGIDFSATPGTGTSELLADYEEGTFTCSYGTFSNVSGSFGTAACTYTKIGRQVFVNATIAGTGMGINTNGYIQFTGMAFTSAVNGAGSWGSTSISSQIAGTVVVFGTEFWLYASNNNSTTAQIFLSFQFNV